MSTCLQTALHILSNGRRFVDPQFARAYAAIEHPDAMLGIPIYSASSQTHDYIVQADGAFDETIRGILNLKTYGQQVEIRVVIHRQNYAHLPALAEFIARNLTFVDHVALMGLEMTGFAKANIETLWIDPWTTEGAVRGGVPARGLGLPTSIYNHQLCTHRPPDLAAGREVDQRLEERVPAGVLRLRGAGAVWWLLRNRAAATEPTHRAYQLDQ